MKLTTKDNVLIVEEVYQGFLMRTSEGNDISICMRDATFEINVMPKGEHTNNWWRIDMETGTIIKETGGKPVVDTDPKEETNGTKS